MTRWSNRTQCGCHGLGLATDRESPPGASRKTNDVNPPRAHLKYNLLRWARSRRGTEVFSATYRSIGFRYAEQQRKLAAAFEIRTRMTGL